MNNKRKMIDYLTGLGNGVIKPRYKSFGLCNNFKIKFGIAIKDMLDFSKYPNYSGNIDYPIKSLNKKFNCYKYYHRFNDMWSGRYGNERKRFCLWCAEQLEKDL